MGDSILKGKKWAVCGDSFSSGDFKKGPEDAVNVITEPGTYQGFKKVYGYIIGNRNEMDIQFLAYGGKCLACPPDGSFHNSFTDMKCNEYNPEWFNYKDIAEDADYITLYFGINDSHHEPGTHGDDGEAKAGPVLIGTAADEDTSTFCGAYNVVLRWLLENRPFAHIGIIVSNGMDRDEYRVRTIEIAKKWGIPYIDLNGDERTPMMIRSSNPVHSEEARLMRTKAMAVNYGVNNHPNAAAHEYESYFIENFLKTL
ncbi:MAG: SGNH/GDSL hydrolase family protein [Eubacteriales bacterium]|nr:SGNH/GDSL hydrolase family protein [Eubacteriales bacterium]